VADEGLLDELLRRTPQQPAVAYWRAIEVRHLLEAMRTLGSASGLGGLGRLGLDLGCGDGAVMGSLARRLPGLRVVGVDLDPAEVSRAAQGGVYERVHVASGASIPEPSETFDWVVANSVLEHIPDVGPVLGEAGRLLKPGGLLWITSPGPEFHDALAGPGLLAPLLGRSVEYFRRLDLRLQHLRYWSARQWTACLVEHGFQVVHASAYMPSRDARRWEFVSSVTGGIAWSLARGTRTNLAIQRGLGISTGSRWNRLLVIPARVLLLISRLKARGPGPLPERHAGLLVVARKSAE
jgi:SAM-dependent methyltransferase